MSARRASSLLLVMLASPWLSPACEIHFALPPIPLPPPVAMKSVEAYLPRHLLPAGVSVPALTLTWGGGGGAFELHDTTAFGLIELFWSAERFTTALAARRVDVAPLASRKEWFRPAQERTPTLKLSPTEATLLRDWLTSDASYLWGEELVELPALGVGARVSFYHAGKVVTMDVHVADGVVLVARADAVVLAQLAPPPAHLESLLARVFQ